MARFLTCPEGDNGRDWTHDEFQTIMRKAPPPLKRFLLFIRFSGMRPGEVRALRWSDIKTELGAIVLMKHKTIGKTKTPRRIPLNTILVKFLAWLRKHTSMASAHVFLNAYGRPWTMRAYTRAFNLLRVRAGLPRDCRCHSGRHSFATHAIMNGVDVATLMQLLGHGCISTTQRYLHLAGKNEHLSNAMEQAVNPKASFDRLARPRKDAHP